MLWDERLYLKRVRAGLTALLLLLAWWIYTDYGRERAFLYVISPSPKGDRIAFDGVIDGKIKLYTMDTDGSRVKALGGEEVTIPQSPDWSPDAQQLAFVDRDGRGWQLFVMDADGDNGHRITTVEGLADAPRWSPDGRYIAFQVSDNETLWLHLVEVASQTVRLLAEGRFPTWSPDSTQLVYFHDQSLYRIHLDDGQPQMIGEGRDPQWSPDGSRIAFWVSQNGVFISDPDGKNRQQLSTIGEMPGWSPDGKRIVFRENPRHLWVMDADGNRAQNLSQDVPFSYLMKPFWAADGRSIFMPRSGGELLRFDADTGRIQKIIAIEHLLSRFPIHPPYWSMIGIAVLLFGAILRVQWRLWRIDKKKKR